MHTYILTLQSGLDKTVDISTVDIFLSNTVALYQTLTRVKFVP